MNDLTPEERALLGLAPDDHAEPLDEAHAEPSSVASARSTAAVLLDDLSPAVGLQPDFDPVLAQRPGVAKLGRWLADPGVYRLPVGAELMDGVSTRFEELEIVDARQQPALIRLRDGNEQLAVRLEGGTVSPFRLQLTSLHPPLPAVAAPEPVTLPAPNIAALLAGEALEQWLDDACGALASSEDASSHLAAVGLLVRAWRPVDSAARTRELERFARGEPGLVHRAREWLASLSETALDAVLEHALDEATHLPERAESLRVAFAQNDAMAGAVALGLVLARDDLASSHAALDLVGRGETLSHALGHADRAIAAHATPLAECEPTVVAALGARVEGTLSVDSDAWWLQVFA